jgi:glycine cleavage system H protein
LKPEALKFTKDHEWIMQEGNTATVGITHFAQKELGDVVYVELPAIGDSYKKGDACSNIESVKAVSDIYAPVTGKIVDVNHDLEDKPEMVNQDPYESGWIMKIEIADLRELEALMDEKKYKEYLDGISKD